MKRTVTLRTMSFDEMYSNDDFTVSEWKTLVGLKKVYCEAYVAITIECGEYLPVSKSVILKMLTKHGSDMKILWCGDKGIIRIG